MTSFLRIIRHPGIHVAVGLAMALTSGWEVIETMEDPSVGAHHGVLLYSLLVVIRSIGEMALGAEEMHKGSEGLLGPR